MAIDTSALTEYVDKNKNSLIAKSVIGARTIGLINVQTGVKHSDSLNLLSTTVAFGDGSTCGFTDSGTSALSERNITVSPIKINMSFCDKLMNKFAGNYQIRTASTDNALPFEEAFVNDVVANIKAEVEKLIWQGKKIALPKKNLDYADGLLEIITKGTASVLKPADTTTGAKATIEAVYKTIPTAILNKAAIFVGLDTFRDYVLGLSAANLYHYNPQVDGEMTIIMPGTTTPIYGVAGLDGTSKVVATTPENLFYGTDLVEDAETFDFWYSKDNQEFRLAVDFKAGTQIAFLNEVVLGTIA